jgi:hypothetical protein
MFHGTSLHLFLVFDDGRCDNVTNFNGKIFLKVNQRQIAVGFLSIPKDFTWEDLVSLLSGFGFEEVSTGKTGGSRRRFLNDTGVIITLHKPHPQNILKRYQIQQIIEILQGEELL